MPWPELASSPADPRGGRRGRGRRALSQTVFEAEPSGSTRDATIEDDTGTARVYFVFVPSDSVPNQLVQGPVVAPSSIDG